MSKVPFHNCCSECSELELVLHFYKPSEVTIECDDGDVEAGSAYYELLEPTKHTGWGVELIPSSSSLVVTHRFAGSNEYMSISPDEKIVGVDHEGKHVALKIQSTVESGFKYIVLMDYSS